MGSVRQVGGDEDAIAGWLEYGAALNEGRAKFPVGDNARFSEWVHSISTDNLSVAPNDHERAAAMWAAANADQFAEARAAGNARTVRGTFGKWIDAEFGMSEATARRFRHVAERFDAKSVTVTVLDPKALYALAAPSTPEEARQAVGSLGLRGDPNL